MTNFNKANETTERKYFVIEERRFYDRARADRSAGALVAHCLGLDASASDAFADRVVEAGIRSQDGRGGFDYLATQIGACGYGIDELRQCYAALSSGATPLSRAA